MTQAKTNAINDHDQWNADNQRRSRIDDEGARRGMSLTKNVSTWRAAIKLLLLTATRPVDPRLTSTSIAWHTSQLSGPLYTRPITAPVHVIHLPWLITTPVRPLYIRTWLAAPYNLRKWSTINLNIVIFIDILTLLLFLSCFLDGWVGPDG